MSAETVIQLKHVAKEYSARRNAPAGTLAEALTFRPRKKRLTADDSKKPMSIRALRDIHLDITAGQAVGVIGKNGAGKTTLLKILSRITPPTQGTITIQGRTSSLLQVGTGFHPELTGRENTFLNGAILGLRRGEIRQRFDDIVSFSEIGRFIDMPIKRYSSGMYVRLAFAIAAHLEPDILLIDEVLAVGDAAFQKKCLQKMEGISRSGQTLLFVSHNLSAVQKLCTRCIVLDGGTVQYDGDPKNAVEYYFSQIIEKNQEERDLAESASRPGDGRARFRKIRIRNSDETDRSIVLSGEPLTFELHLQIHQKIITPRIAISIKNNSGQTIARCYTWESVSEIQPLEKDVIIRCRIASLPLLAGDFYLSVWLNENGNTIDLVDYATHFQVRNNDIYGTGREPDNRYAGHFLIPHSWEFHTKSKE